MSRPESREEFRRAMADSFINVLNEKGLSWKKEWSSMSAPYNAVTKSRYRGCNAFSLSLESVIKGYGDPRWVTMNQIRDLSGKYHPESAWHLRKGSKASYVEYWYPFDTKSGKGLAWDDYRVALDAGRNKNEFVLYSKYIAVFNASLVDGMPPAISESARKAEAPEILDRLVEGMGVGLAFDGGNDAYYSWRDDSVHMPEKSAFESDYAYASVCLHELAHATGHVSRLCRKLDNVFGTPEYAYEELIAEMSSCFARFDFEIAAPPGYEENHLAYVKSWVELIDSKPEALISAVRDAQGIADYMDLRAGLITEKEYAPLRDSALTVRAIDIDSISQTINGKDSYDEVQQYPARDR